MPQPPELDVLLEYLVLSAREIIAKHGEVYPLAAVIDRSLGVAAFTVDEDDDHPDPDALIADLVDGLRAGASRGEYVATGICVDVEFAEGSGRKKNGLSVRLDRNRPVIDAG